MLTEARVVVYSVDMPGKGGGDRRTTGLSPASNVGTIVKVHTDEGISGLGEVCVFSDACLHVTGARR